LITLKEINRLAIPAILYNITEPLIGLVDTAIIGGMEAHPTEAQGGVGLAAGLFSLLVWSLAQLRTAVSAITSQYYGKGDLDFIKPLIPQALFISFLLGVGFWAGTSLWYTEICTFLYDKSDALTLTFSTEYYTIRSLGLPLALLVACFFGIFRGMQNTTWAMVISLVGGAVNLVLDLILVHGIEGVIPAYGVAGAAWASFVAQAVMTLLAIIMLLRKTPFNLKFQFVRHPELKQLIQLTVNMMIRTVVLNIAFILANRYANGYGKTTLAAYTIGLNIWLFSSFFIDGFSNAGNALAGKYLGAKDYVSLKLLGRKLNFINIGIGTGLGLVYLALYPFLGKLFTNDPGVLETFNGFFWIVIIAQPLNAIAFTFDGIFKGLGEAKFLRNLLLIATIGVFIPLLIIGDALQWHIYGVWFSFVGWMAVRGIGLLIRFRRKYHKLALKP
jgi:MATE family multidrug resistance protein